MNVKKIASYITFLTFLFLVKPVHSFTPPQSQATTLSDINAPVLSQADLEPSTKQLLDWELFNEKESGRYRIKWSKETGSAYIIQNAPEKFIAGNYSSSSEDRAKEFIKSLGSIFEGRTGSELKVIKIFEVPIDKQIKSSLNEAGFSFTQSMEDELKYYLNKFYDAEKFLLEKRDALLQKYGWKVLKLNNKKNTIEEKKDELAKTISKKAVLNGVVSDNTTLEQRAYGYAPYYNFYYPPANIEIQGLSSFMNEI